MIFRFFFFKNEGLWGFMWALFPRIVNSLRGETINLHGTASAIHPKTHCYFRKTSCKIAVVLHALPGPVNDWAWWDLLSACSLSFCFLLHPPPSLPRLHEKEMIEHIVFLSRIQTTRTHTYTAESLLKSTYVDAKLQGNVYMCPL